MAPRVLVGRRPDGAETGFWVSKPGYNAITDDRTDRNKFSFSSSFVGRRPLRIVASGYSQTRAAISIPDLSGGEPILAVRMMDSGQERANIFYGTQNDGSGGSFSATEVYSRYFVNSNGSSYFVVYRTRSENDIVDLRYMIAVF